MNNAAKGRSFWNVSMVDTPNDDQGCTCTFATEAEAESCAAWAREKGMWSVTVWKS